MSLSERQKLLRLQEYAKEEDEKILDVFNCVERLHDTDMRKAITTERGEWVLTKIPRHNRPPGKASLQRLTRALPRHIMGCLLARQPSVPPDDATPLLTDAPIGSASCFGHIAKALQLLCNLCDSAAQHRGLRAEMLLCQDFHLEVVDAINLVLLAMAGPEAERCLAAAEGQGTMQEALDHAAMVPNALRALAYAFTAVASEDPEPSVGGMLSWDSVVGTLLQHPRGAVLLDAAFDAVRTLVVSVRGALTNPGASSEDVYKLAFYAGAAMELLSYLCTTPLFYHRLMIHDPSGAAPLRLMLACLALHDAPLAAPPYARLPPRTPGAPTPPGVLPAGPATGPLACFAPALPPYITDKGKGAAELLVARGFALVVMLAEYEEPSYMDQLFEHPETQRLASDVLERAAAYIAQVLLRPSTTQHPPAAGEPQMAINILRAAELFCDDSNFKSGLIQRLSLEIALLLSMDPKVFQSRWCVGEDARSYHQRDEILVNSVSHYALEGVEQLEKAAKRLIAAGGGGKGTAKTRVGVQLGLERSVLLYKMVGNLHNHTQGSVGASETFAARLLTALRPSQVAMAQALHNLRQLQATLAPFGPPKAPEELELLSEVDLNLFADLIGQLERAMALPRQPVVLQPVPTQLRPVGGLPPYVVQQASQLPPQLQQQHIPSYAVQQVQLQMQQQQQQPRPAPGAPYAAQQAQQQQQQVRPAAVAGLPLSQAVPPQQGGPQVAAQVLAQPQHPFVSTGLAAVAPRPGPPVAAVVPNPSAAGAGIVLMPVPAAAAGQAVGAPAAGPAAAAAPAEVATRPRMPPIPPPAGADTAGKA